MRYIIIGNGAAGNAAAEAIRRRDRKGEVIIISDEPHPAYYRPLLFYLIHNGPGLQSLFRDELHIPKNITLYLGRRVKDIEVKEKAVLLDNGQRIYYDALLLATGSVPIFPPIPGLRGPGVWALNRIDDAKGIADTAKKAKRVVIIGGGRIATKVALSLRYLGLEVNLVVRRFLLRIVLDEIGRSIVHSILEREGVNIFMGRQVSQIVREGEELKGVILDDGRFLPADLIVMATGVKPNLELAIKAGCAVGKGIKVGKYLETSVPYIYAAGDVAETVDLITGEPMVTGTWANAVEMGYCAGENMAGGKMEFPGALRYNAMELAGHPFISVGIISPPETGYQVQHLLWGNNYKKLVFKDDQLVGMILIGEAISGAGVYTCLIKERKRLGAIKDRLIEPGFSAAHFLALPLPIIDAYIT